jgi:hypothetical protein
VAPGPDLPAVGVSRQLQVKPGLFCLLGAARLMLKQDPNTCVNRGAFKGLERVRSVLGHEVNGIVVCCAGEDQTARALLLVSLRQGVPDA